MRSPSYNGNDNNSKVLKSEQINHKRKISVEKSNDQFTSLFLLQTNNNNVPPNPAYDKHKPSYSPSPQLGKNALDVPRDELAKDRRAMSSEKFYNLHNHREEPKT